MTRVVHDCSLLDLNSIGPSVGKVAGDRPGERSAGGSAEGSDGVKVSSGAPTKDNSGGGLVLGRIGDGVGPSSLDTGLRVVIDLELSGGCSNQGRARENDLEETHVDEGVECR